MGLIKKRKRVAGGTATGREGARAKAVAEAAAGEANLDSDDESSVASAKEKAVSEDEFFETPDEKRVRVAKEYLGKIGDGGKSQAEVQEQLNQDIEETTKRARMQIEDVELGEPRLLKGHKLPPTCVCLTADDRTAYSAGKDCHVMRWDIETGVRDHFPGGRNKFECGGHFAQVLSIAVSEARQTLLSVGVDRVVRLWDHRAPRHTLCRDALMGHSGDTTGVAVEEDGNTFYTASLDKSLKIWDMRRLRCSETLFGHVSGVTCLDLAFKGRPLTGGEDKTVRLWNIDKETHLMFSKHTYSVDAVTMVDQERFLSGSQDGSMSLWSNASKKPLAAMSLGASRWITALRAIRRGNVVFSSAMDGHLRCWRFGRGEADPAGDEGKAAKGKDKGLKLTEAMKPLPVPGIVNSIAVGRKVLVCAVAREHRLGRWSYDRSLKNGVLVVPLSYREVEKGTGEAKP